MKTLLVIAEHPDLAEAVRSVLASDRYRVIHRPTVEEAEPLLANGLTDLCLLDADLNSVQGVWFLEKLRRRAPKTPIIIYAASRQWEWEEEAYLQGVIHVLAKPVRGRLLNELLNRLWNVSSSVAINLLPVPAPAAQTFAVETRPV